MQHRLGEAGESLDEGLAVQLALGNGCRKEPSKALAQGLDSQAEGKVKERLTPALFLSEARQDHEHCTCSCRDVYGPTMHSSRATEG